MRKSPVAVLIALAALAAAWWLLGDATEASWGGVAVEPEPGGVAGPAAPDGGAPARALRWEEAERLLVPPSSEAAAAPSSAVAALHGRVLDLRTGVGVAAHKVVVEVPAQGLPAVGEVASEDTVLEAVTDADGAFELRPARPLLPQLVAHAVVYDSHPSPVFAGHLLVVDGMTLLVEPAQFLRGRIVDAGALCGDGDTGFALLQERPGLSALVRSLGSGVLDREGRFEVRARAAWPDLPVAIKIGCGEQMFALSADVATLTSPAGFTGALGLGSTTVHVLGPQGAPVTGAVLVASPPHTAANGAYVRRVTDATGTVTLPVPAAGLELAVAAFEMRIATTTVAGAPCPAEVTVRLEALDALDYVQGTVTDATGAPVEGAVVTALPDATAAAVRVLDPVQARTDADGRFRLRAGTDGIPFAVTAFHRRHGMSRVWNALPGGPDGALVVPGVRSLRIHAVAPQSDSRSRGGDVQWYVVPDGPRGLGVCGAGALPIETEPVAAGDYRLLLLWADMDLFAEARVTVPPGASDRAEELVVLLEPAAWFEGTVTGAGPGASVRWRNPDWPADVVAAWGTAPLSQGRFRVFAGRRDRGVVEVLDGAGKTLTTAEVRWGIPAAIAVR